MAAAAILLAFLALLIAGMPIAFALGLAAVAGMVVLGGVDSLGQVGLLAYQALDNSALLAVPQFILMGSILLRGRVGGDLFDFATAFLGHRRGGLAIATIVACAIFSSISASSLATAATIGSLSVPGMLKNGYPQRLTFGPVAAGGTLGILIPPSTTMILFGAMTSVSVGDLFIAGVLPGIVLTLLFSGMAILLAGGSEIKPLPRKTWRERWEITVRSKWSLILPVIVFGGLYSGLFTPNEAGALGVIASLIITVFVTRTLRVSELPSVLLEGTKTTGFLFAIIVAASLFNHLMTEAQIMQNLTSWVTGLNLSQSVALLAIAILLILLGMFFEVASIVLIMVPILYPIVLALNIDPLWFGIFFVVCIETAYVTPPVGMNLYIIQDIAGRYCKTSFGEVMRSSLPYTLCLVLILFLLWAFPWLATALPRV